MADQLTKYSNDSFELGDQVTVLGEPDHETLSTFEWGGNDTFLGGSDVSGYTAYGDALYMEEDARGGNDLFVGGSNVTGESPSVAGFGFFGFGFGGVFFAGDASEMSGTSQGGNDVFIGGSNSMNTFVGDAADSMSGNSVGGNDVMLGGTTSADDTYVMGGNFMIGDAGSLYESAVAGNDFLLASATTSDNGGSANSVNFQLGDAYGMYDTSVGGNDTLLASSAVSMNGAYASTMNLMSGDGYDVGDAAVAGSDTLIGGSAIGSESGMAMALNIMTGDGYALGGSATAGNDMLIGGSAQGGSEAWDGWSHTAGALNVMAGDALFNNDIGPLTLGEGDSAPVITYGNDTLVGGSAGGDGYVVNSMFGDVGFDLFGNGIGLPFGPSNLGGVSEFSSEESWDSGPVHVYGNDTLTGGSGAQNTMVGDTQELGWGDTGGNDMLVAGGDNSYNMMVGDAYYIDCGATGGNDTLVSGTSDDQMWGDALYMDGDGGADTFVFAASNGNDTVQDFSTCNDTIDLSALNFESLEQLWCEGRVEQTCEGTVLHLGADYGSEESFWCETDTVTLTGVYACDLSDGNFVFAAPVVEVV